MPTMTVMSEKDDDLERSETVPISFPESRQPYHHHHHTRSTSLRSPLASPAFSVSGSIAGSRDSEISSVRPSRASSIVSTRTKVSVNTIAEDARSIDLLIGGQSFRIARDGSRVTTASSHDSLPPYSPLGSRFITQDDVVSLMSAENESLEAASTFERPLSRASVASDATQTVIELNDEAASINDAVISVDLTPQFRRFGIGQNSAVLQAFREQYENVPLPPLPSRAELDAEPISPTTTATAGLQPNDDMTSNQQQQTTPNTANRRQGYWFVSMLSSLIGKNSNIDGSNNGHSRNRKSFRDSIDTDDSEYVSEYIRKLEQDPFLPSSSNNNNNAATAAGNFNFDEEPASSSSTNPSTNPNHTQSTSTDSADNTPTSSRSSPTPSGPLNTNLVNPTPSFSTLTPSRPPPPPPPTDPLLNDSPTPEVRTHYISILRSLDRTHRTALQARESQISALTAQLSALQAQYTQLLTTRDTQISTLESQLTTLESSISSMLDRARNEVEDLWESRWRDRDGYFMERGRRAEIEVREEWSHKVDDLQTQHSRQLSDLESQHASQIADMEFRHRSQLREMEMRYTSKINERDEVWRDKVRELEEEVVMYRDREREIGRHRFTGEDEEGELFKTPTKMTTTMTSPKSTNAASSSFSSATIATTATATPPPKTIKKTQKQKQQQQQQQRKREG